MLDGEVVALSDAGIPLPFQTTMRRFGRRLDLDAVRDELPLTPLLFDVLRVNGTDLFDRPDRARRAELERIAPDLVVKRVVTNDAAEAQAFYEEVLTARPRRPDGEIAGRAVRRRRAAVRPG